MSLPISPHALSGAAGLAARATLQVAKGSFDAVSNFADVLAKTQPDHATEPGTSPLTEQSLSSTRQSLHERITDLLRHFGITTDQPLGIGLSQGGDQVQIEAPGGSLELRSRLSEMQASMNADESLRSVIVESLRQLPDQTYLLAPTQPSP
jgi:hypothetical protein